MVSRTRASSDGRLIGGRRRTRIASANHRDFTSMAPGGILNPVVSHGYMASIPVYEALAMFRIVATALAR